VRVVDQLAAGRLDLAHLRGRSGLARPAQAAEVLVRRELGEDRLDAVRVVGVTSEGDDVTLVTLVVDGAQHRARIRRAELGTALPASCDAGTTEDPGAYVLLEHAPA